jgi:hypothetical protein
MADYEFFEWSEPAPTEVPFLGAPSMAPTYFVASASTESPTDLFIETNMSYFSDNVVWMVLWFCTVIVFLGFPFLSRRRRQLCMMGIRERRWINDEDWDEFESNSSERERRQQQREETLRRFQTSRTQEDEIRQQYLSHLLERYTVELNESDIHDGKDKCADDMETESSDEEKDQVKTDVENQCDTTVTDRGSHDTIDTDENKHAEVDIEAPTPVRKDRADSEDSDNLLAFEFNNNQTVCVPIAGETSTDETRKVSNGCAICLCSFEADEKVSYSSNPDCRHVFHNDCIVNWYLAVGRKTQGKRKKNNPNMTDEEALDLICDFPINCPSCRQPFCPDTNPSGEKADDSESLASADV